jgi:hypothetical protein
MFESIESYLKALKFALREADPALVQDALWDAEAHLGSGLAALKAEHPEMPQPEALASLLATFGTPEEVGEAYLEREALVAKAMHPQGVSPAGESDAPLAPWPGLFEVLKTPKAYTSLLYLVMSLATGIFFFTWAVTGLSLSLGLFILIIGIPFTLAFLGSVRMLALVEGRLVEALLDVRMPRRPSLLPEGKGWMERLKNLLTDGHTWTSLAYLVLHLPLGILFFTLMVVGLSLSISFMLAPIAHWLFGASSTVDFGYGQLPHTGWILILNAVGGFFGLLGTLHLALALGRFQGFLAKHMLVRR